MDDDSILISFGVAFFFAVVAVIGAVGGSAYLIRVGIKRCQQRRRERQAVANELGSRRHVGERWTSRPASTPTTNSPRSRLSFQQPFRDKAHSTELEHCVRCTVQMIQHDLTTGGQFNWQNDEFEIVDGSVGKRAARLAA
ncbi:Uu.00g111260.m01.CDS01 [Anthostomella pinea]|uniref:Uu.00g111260.m01.CDS01 n=1 Tax=Anthostomella pinea TaxID=933095 RepID=A0AAI8YDX8_9PEZI|nr:Uu.00g111260.m01.CDS01 [Anthostomella pinea]